MLCSVDVHSMRRRFHRLGEFLDEDDKDLLATAACQDPGEKLLRGLQLSQAFLPDYQRLLETPAVAAAEDDSAMRKVDFHDHWRRRHCKEP